MDEYDLVRNYYTPDKELDARLEWVNCELYDTDRLSTIFSDCDAVVHIAGLIGYLKKDRSALMEVNVQGTASVVNACLDAKINNLLFMSSIAANGKRTDDARCSEEDEWVAAVPHSYYGYTKHLAELEVWRGREEGLGATILRPGIILGYGNWNKSSLKLFRFASRSFPFYSEGITGFTGVEDLCRVCVKCVEEGADNQVYLVINENQTYRWVSEQMAEALGARPPFIAVRGALYLLTITALWIKERLGFSGTLSLETARSSISVQPYDGSRLQSMLPFDLQPLDHVIRQACLAYKKNSPPR